MLVADPAADPDVGDFFRRLPAADYLPTWHAQRSGGALGAHEQAAATQNGRPRRDAHRRAHRRARPHLPHRRPQPVQVQQHAAADPPHRGASSARACVFDIEGNQREVDRRHRPRGRCATTTTCSATGIHQASMEAGERWMLNDVAGKPLYAWDSRGHRLPHRPTTRCAGRRTRSCVQAAQRRPRWSGATVYGEIVRPDRRDALTCAGKVVQLFDQAGVVTSDAYDFKGNLLRSQPPACARTTRRRSTGRARSPLEADTYTSRTRFDALNRPTRADRAGRQRRPPRYNEANLLERVDVNLRGDGRRPAGLDAVRRPTSTTTPRGSARGSTTATASQDRPTTTTR